jgi:replicative DNA helicase
LPAAGHLTHRVRNPVASWLDDLGVFGLRSHEKRVPDGVFEQNNEGVAVFLRHLWATDGCIWARAGRDYPVIRFDSSSERLTRDVQALLLRLAITAQIRKIDMGSKGRPVHRLQLTGRPDIERFLERIGGIGRQRATECARIGERVASWRPSTKRDVIPKDAWQTIVPPAMAAAALTTHEIRAAIGTTPYRSALSRDRAARVAAAVESQVLRDLAESDVYWDEVVSIERAGSEEVFDLTVEGLHNFVADCIIPHNSIEQDSDLVFFIYRDEYYNAEESDQQGLAEVHLAKHRNGPTDVVKLSFLKRFAKFADLAA